jgi:hypothetical protein
VAPAPATGYHLPAFRVRWRLLGRLVYGGQLMRRSRATAVSISHEMMRLVYGSCQSDIQLWGGLGDILHRLLPFPATNDIGKGWPAGPA